MTVQLFWPLAKIDDEAREVAGYASTEATDSQGEIVTLEALAAALPDYMKWANIREMHQPSAVGVAQAAEVDGKGLLLRAKVIDDAAWRKVKAGVYKGFSIGGAVTARDPQRPNVITGVDLLEISLVDRPANPEAVFAVWKFTHHKEQDMNVLEDARPMEAALKAARARLAQKWVATDGSAFERADDAARHEMHLAKSTFAPATEPTAGLTGYDLDGADTPRRDDEPDPVQQIHDHAVALGAQCGGDHDPTEKLAGAAIAKLDARNAALEAQLREVKDLLDKVAAQPAVMPPSRLVAIDKGADVARELERIADQPPAVTAFELIKRAMREPLPFGGALEK